jgi:hypothetical protein
MLYYQLNKTLGVSNMADQSKEYVTLNVTRDTRQRAKYISATTGKQMNEIMSSAVRLLQEKLDLPDPPTRKVE